MQPVAFPNEAPSVCFICESVPMETPFVDTLRNFTPPGLTPLNGRKYLCETCVNEAAHALGLYDEVQARAEGHAELLATELANTTEKLAAFEQLQALVDGLTNPTPVEDKTEEKVAAVKAKKANQKQAAEDERKAREDQAAAEVAGAERQVELDREAADAYAAKGQVIIDAANAAASAEPPAPPEQVIPVTDGQGNVVDVNDPPSPGQVWDGSTASWVTPEEPVVTVLPQPDEAPKA
jgi:hypothetical protein